jgi:hypothetical protein
LNDAQYYSLRLTGTWLDRMLEVYGDAIEGESQLGAIRDKDGNLIQEATSAATNSPTVFTLGFRLDWTDDYLDPRRGIRYQLSRWWTNNDDLRDPEYYQLEHNLTGYIPVGKRSTVVLNYFQSDANVTRQGETDFATVEAEQGLDCSDPGLTSRNRRSVPRLLIISLPIIPMVRQKAWAAGVGCAPTLRAVSKVHIPSSLVLNFVRI